ncbi:MAG: YdcF family protein [Bryobacteraceae bacterium]
MPRRRYLFFFGFLLAACALYLCRDAWLSAMGRMLVHDDGPAKAEIAVVLAGDGYGHRIEKAADLVRRGFVPTVLVDGTNDNYGLWESDMAIAFIARQGFPAAWFVGLHCPTNSTAEEAGIVMAELRRRNIHSFLLVTSDYHSGRARRIFLSWERHNGYAPAMRVVVSHDEYFTPSGWWRDREARKIVLIEWMKTFAAAVGM